jgi:hypothetical protein
LGKLRFYFFNFINYLLTDFFGVWIITDLNLVFLKDDELPCPLIPASGSKEEEESDFDRRSFLRLIFNPE